MNNLFNKWISMNFKGLSAHTLCQLIGMEYDMPKEYIDNMIYVDLFGYFTGNKCDNNTNVYWFCRRVSEYCL